MKMKKLNIYIIGLLTLMLCGIQSCALESEVFDEITPSIYTQTERDVWNLLVGPPVTKIALLILGQTT